LTKGYSAQQPAFLAHATPQQSRSLTLLAFAPQGFGMGSREGNRRAAL